MLIGFTRLPDKLEFAEVSAGIEQHCHSEPVLTTFVGISIEFQAAYRHPFVGVVIVSARENSPNSSINSRQMAPFRRKKYE